MKPLSNVLTVDLVPLGLKGEIALGYERATSAYTAFLVRTGYRFGNGGTNISNMRLGPDFEFHLGTAVRFYPLGRAPTQLFVSPGIEVHVGREINSVGTEGREASYNLQVQTAGWLAAGWAFHFFERWALSVQGGVVSRSFAFFFNKDAGTSSQPGVVPYFSLETGVAF